MLCGWNSNSGALQSPVHPHVSRKVAQYNLCHDDKESSKGYLKLVDFDIPAVMVVSNQPPLHQILLAVVLEFTVGGT